MDIDLELLSNKNKLKKNNFNKDISSDLNFILKNILEIELNDTDEISKLLVKTNKSLNNIYKRKDVSILEYLKLNILIIQFLKKREIEDNNIKNNKVKEEDEINFFCREIIDDIITKIEQKNNTKNIDVGINYEKSGIEKYIIVKTANQ